MAIEDREALDTVYRKFAYASQKELNLLVLENYEYLTRLPKTTERDNIREAIKKKYPVLASEAIVFKPNNEPYEKKGNEVFPWIFIAFGASCLVFFFMVLIKKIDTYFEVAKEIHEVEKKENQNLFLHIILPTRDYYVTPAILIINVLVFLFLVTMGAGFIDFKSEALIAWGGNLPSLTRGQGQWWRLLTSTFLHGGLLHVGFNMYALVYVGPILERVLGNIKYLVLYLLAGVLASVASLWWHGDAEIVSVGASGVIFGAFGCFLALFFLKKFNPEFKKAFLPNILFFVGFNLLYGMQGNIDNAAHIGGLVAGFLLGIILSWLPDKREDNI